MSGWRTSISERSETDESEKGLFMIELATEVRWQDRRFEVPMERILLSEKLGYDAVFTAEGYGSESLVPLGYIAAHTKWLKLGTRIMQVTGRAPAMAAMAYQTLNHLTGGNRVIAGLGSAAPLACEGFQGRPWGSPVKRMRDFVAILRQGLAGQAINHKGEEWSAPYRGSCAKGIEPAALGLDVISEIPIIIGASGPQMTTLAAEIGDGSHRAGRQASCPCSDPFWKKGSPVSAPPRPLRSSRSGRMWTYWWTTMYVRPCAHSRSMWLRGRGCSVHSWRPAGIGIWPIASLG